MMLEENNKIIKNIQTNEVFKIIKKLGEGSYGKVYKCCKEDKSIWAIKEININNYNYGFDSNLLREVTILNLLNHENIIKSDSIFYNKNKCYIVMEYLNSTLSDIFRKKITEKDIKCIFYQILCGVNHIHSSRVIHRDLKFENILIDYKNNEYIVKIADFGLSRLINQPMRSYSLSILTPFYMPPEIILNDKNYGIEVDLWTIGVIMAQIYYKNYLFYGSSQLHILLEIIKIRGYKEFNEWTERVNLKLNSNEIPKLKGIKLENLIPTAPKKAIDLIENFLKIDPKQRITCKEALKNSWFDDIRSNYD